eukprot:gnl/TRDRNA2_/TRDRNA2_87294_c0_seq2.p1 gnl/TRDRNA2_/TRDRNA2_87294_c0~~gnl/TRDRNA2_/TRDRNA2_87294_c0_seq2.p1  ORF type:complete len:101 (+),score=6.12 gnl/TRDRNA2_/TRDRNA2_87294_c0_seq2:268-570(+)
MEEGNLALLEGAHEECAPFVETAEDWDDRNVSLADWPTSGTYFIFTGARRDTLRFLCNDETCSACRLEAKLSDRSCQQGFGFAWRIVMYSRNFSYVKAEL